MRTTLLEILQCPFCGGALSPVEADHLEMFGGEMLSGILACACCAYPVVDGIPVMTLDYAAETAMRGLGEGQKEQAFFTMLGLDESKHDAFRGFLAKGREATYSEGIEILSPDAEGTYFVYRFSDPTYLATQAVVSAVGQNACCSSQRMMDLCGGSGHLTRVLTQVSPEAEVVLADAGFAKLWLAKHITAPGCLPVCCDANNPLPFAQHSFSLIVCSDAYHYIWSKRLLACEMMRLAGEDGILMLPHIHNSLGENFSAGMPLTPAHYRSLFANLDARLFRESSILTQFLNRDSIDLSVAESDQALANEAALALIASSQEEIFRSYEPTIDKRIAGQLRLNPLYHLDEDGELANLELQFPSEMYADEYGACKRYLPERMTLRAELLRQLEAGEISEEHRELARRFVLIDAPLGYC